MGTGPARGETTRVALRRADEAVSSVNRIRMSTGEPESQVGLYPVSQSLQEGQLLVLRPPLEEAIMKSIILLKSEAATSSLNKSSFSDSSAALSQFDAKGRAAEEHGPGAEVGVTFPVWNQPV